MIESRATRRWGRLPLAAAILATLAWPSVALARPQAAGSAAQVGSASGTPRLMAKVSRWVGDPVHKIKGPEGFDLKFRLVGLRFDGTFSLEGLPQSVPEAEAFDVQLSLTNIGARKELKVASVSVVGDGLVLTTRLVDQKVEAKTVGTVASFRVPPQSRVGSSFLITVVLKNGDKHQATLSFTPES